MVGEAADGAEALTLAADLAPDVVLLDVLLPDTTGFDVASRLAATDVDAVVVLTSTRSADDLADRLRACPAAGFIPKDHLTIDTFREVARC